MADCSHLAMRRLETELAYIPIRLRGAHLQRIAEVIPTLADDALYTYGDIFHRVTQFDPDSGGGELIVGSAVLRDLGVMLQKLSRECPLDGCDPDRPVLPVAAVLSQQRVTLRTLRRWTMSGLPMAMYHLPQGGSGWAVRKDFAERFFAQRGRRAASAGKVGAEERQAILDRVAVLQEREDLSGAPLLRRVAQETGRSEATIRRLLAERAEAARASQPLFAEGLPASRRDDLIRAYRSGVSVRELAGRLEGPTTTVRRILYDVLQGEIARTRITYVPHPDFAAPDAEARCLGPEGLDTPAPQTEEIPSLSDAPEYIREVSGIPLLEREQEQHLFRKYNYLKYRLAILQEQLREEGCDAARLDRFQALRRAADQARSVLIRCNLRLVVSVARRHAGPVATLMDLVSEGNVCLIRAVECYDAARPVRFATYATWALTKHFARVVPEENYHLRAFVTGDPERLDRAAHTDTARERTENLAHLRALLARATRQLNPREQEILAAHFGADGRPAQTLEEIGQGMGLTRERVRQIEAGALVKLRTLVDPEALDAV